MLAERCRQVCQQLSNYSSLANPFGLLQFVFITVIQHLMSCYCAALPLSLSAAVWTIYALAALLILTVIAMVAKLLLHITVK